MVKFWVIFICSKREIEKSYSRCLFALCDVDVVNVYSILFGCCVWGFFLFYFENLKVHFWVKITNKDVDWTKKNLYKLLIYVYFIKNTVWYNIITVLAAVNKLD